MRRRLIPMNVVMAVGLFTLLSMGPDQGKPSKEMMERGKAVYSRLCSDIQPVEISKQAAPDNTKTDSKWALCSKKKLLEEVLDGETGANEMDCYVARITSMSKHLTDQEIADVLTYVRNSFGNKSATVTPVDVKKVRLSLAKKNKTKIS